MADRVACSSDREQPCIREAVCINTRKIFDSCRDKDCVDDLRVYPTLPSQRSIDSALSIRPKSAELLHAEVHVEPMGFNRGYYTVDCRYFYRVTGETYPAGDICTGVAIFDKRVMLFGSEGGVKSYSSEDEKAPAFLPQSDLPTATVDSVDPIALHMRLSDSEIRPEACSCCEAERPEKTEIPEFISSVFSDALNMGDCCRRWYVSIGQFSIIRLERKTQLLIPAYDYCVPEKECPGCSEPDDPCTMFGRVRFPVEEFFPPDSISGTDEYKNMK